MLYYCTELLPLIAIINDDKNQFMFSKTYFVKLGEFGCGLHLELNLGYGIVKQNVKFLKNIFRDVYYTLYNIFINKHH